MSDSTDGPKMLPMWMANLLKLTSDVSPDDYVRGYVIAFYTPDTHLVKGSTIDHVRMAAEYMIGRRSACRELVGRRIVQQLEETRVRQVRRPIGVKFGRPTNAFPIFCTPVCHARAHGDVCRNP